MVTQWLQRLTGRSRSRRPRRFQERLWAFFLHLLYIVLGIAVVSLVGMLGWGLYQFVYHSDYFEIRDVRLRVVGEDNPDVDEERLTHELRGALIRSGLDGGNLVALDPDAMRMLIENHSWVESASVRKRYPGWVEVEILPRRVVALLLGDPILAVDREGVVVDRLGTRSPLAVRHPYVSGIETGRVSTGSRVDSEGLTKCLGLLLSVSVGLPDFASLISEVHLGRQRDLTLILRGGTEVRFGRGDPVEKMPALETFLREQGDPLRQAYIDLRFEGQVPFMTRQEARQREASKQ